MADLTVLVTACGGQFIPGLIECIKNNGERDIRIVGVDLEMDQTILQMADVCYQVPAASDPKYVDIIFDICVKEKVNIVLPVMSADLIPLIMQKKRFEKAGILLSVSDEESVRITTNKYNLYCFLKAHGLNVPRFALINNVEELEAACKAVGYPARPVCVKATELSGSRGIRIIDPEKSRFDIFFHEKPNSMYITLEELKETLSEKQNMPEMMAMEYLPGMEGSVDLLADHGRVLYMAYRQSNVNLASIPQTATLAENKEACEIAEAVVTQLGLDGNADLDFKNDAEGRPVLMEINPRIAATMQIFKVAGLNLPYLRIKQLLGEELPEIDIKYGIVMKRRYLEMFC